MEAKLLQKPAQERLMQTTNTFYSIIEGSLKDGITLDSLKQEVIKKAEEDIAKHGQQNNKTQKGVNAQVINLLILQTLALKSTNTAESINATQSARESQSVNIADFEEQILPYDRLLLQKLNDAIDTQKLEAYLTTVRQELSEYKGKRRKHAIALINGFTLAGKGTAMKANNISAVETGTEGIVGANDDYAHWAEVMNYYDIPRHNSDYYPDNLMILAIAMELSAQRQKLDKDPTKIDSPVFISGFPRTAGQVAFLAGIPTNQVVPPFFFRLNAKTALTRTIYRMFQDYTNIALEFDWRTDDLKSIESEELSLNELKNALLIEFNYLNDKYPDKNLENEQKINQALHEFIDVFKLNLGNKARWHRDEGRMRGVIEQFSQRFPEHTKAIAIVDVDELSKEQQAATLRDFLNRYVS